MKKDIHKNIIWEKTYYNPTYFSNAYKYFGSKKLSGDWSGVLLIYRFIFKKPFDKIRFVIEPDVMEFGGKNKEKMINNLEEKIKEIEEWTETGNKNWKELDIFPIEVEQKLKEYKINYKRIK